MDDLIGLIIFIVIGLWTLIGQFAKSRKPDEYGESAETEKPHLELPEELQDILFGRRHQPEPELEDEEEWVPARPRKQVVIAPPRVPMVDEDSGRNLRPQDLKPLRASPAPPVAATKPPPTAPVPKRFARAPQQVQAQTSKLFANLNDVRRGIIMSEILAKPVSVRKSEF